VTGGSAERRLVRGNRGRAQSLRQTTSREEEPADQPSGHGRWSRSGSVVQITTVGNLTAEPELRYTATGTGITRFTIASNDREFDPILGHWRDMPTLFTHCIVRGAQAEHAAVTLHRGHRVIVLGQLRPPSSAYRGGRRGKTAELGVVEIALSLRYTQLLDSTR
jgi:single stranded DNA-binding protein